MQITALGGLDQAIIVHIAANQEIGDELEARDFFSQPGTIFRGFDIIPSGNQGARIGVEKVGEVPVADELARFMACGVAEHFGIEPVFNRSAHQRHEGDARCGHGYKQGLISIEP